MANPLAIVTGASTGIGFELAHCCATAMAQQGFDTMKKGKASVVTGFKNRMQWQ
jgi:NAD(P)-dependent dehydrogenase (short-subunit alcohol dehydrogenase family)